MPLSDAQQKNTDTQMEVNADVFQSLLGISAGLPCRRRHVVAEAKAR